MIPSTLLNASSKQHVMLLYKSQDKCNQAAISCINDGLREGQFCVYASVNAYDSSHIADFSSSIKDYEQNIVNGNLSIVNFRPHYESALKGDLTPFIQLKMDLEKILRQRIIEGKVGKIMIFADAACSMSQNRQFAECIMLEKWWNDVHAAWIKDGQNITVICPHPSSTLKEESALYMKRQIGAQHSITIDIDKNFPLTGTKTKPIRILVAEPDMDIRNLYYSYLNSLGFDVVTVESGNKCLEYAFDSTSDAYDMILLDSHLHDIGGLEVAKNIRNRIPNQRIVLTTTYPWGQISNSLGSIGINQEDVMLKPFKFSKLLSVIKPKLAN